MDNITSSFNLITFLASLGVMIGIFLFWLGVSKTTNLSLEKLWTRWRETNDEMCRLKHEIGGQRHPVKQCDYEKISLDEMREKITALEEHLNIRFVNKHTCSATYLKN